MSGSSVLGRAGGFLAGAGRAAAEPATEVAPCSGFGQATPRDVQLEQGNSRLQRSLRMRQKWHEIGRLRCC